MKISQRLTKLESQQPTNPDDIPLLIVQRGVKRWEPTDDEKREALAEAFAQHRPYAVLRPPRQAEIIRKLEAIGTPEFHALPKFELGSDGQFILAKLARIMEANNYEPTA